MNDSGLLEALNAVWPYVIAVVTWVSSVLASGHAILYKRDPRSAVLWTGLIWLLPLAGALLYFILGINRIRRRAMVLRGQVETYRSLAPPPASPAETLAEHLPPEAHRLISLASLVDQVVQRPLVPSNTVEPLIDGDEAYPAMLAAIQGAKSSIALSTYIYDRDEAGYAFADALGKAARRGVEVRILIDAAGTRYTWPSILGTLRREGIRHARFLRTFPLRHLVSINLRNHRKILVIDGATGFTGGMNIRIGHWLSKKPAHPVRDMHFRLDGPIVAHLQEAFAEDWRFTTGEILEGDRWFPPLQPAGSVFARGIIDGPDEDFERLRWTLLGALAAARRSVRIMTPYFLPEPALISALNLAALRGVDVDILLPSRNNLPFIHWASQAHWWQMLERGCRIWLTPPPFDHSKLFVVDDCWTLIGSTNWDPRSLRLNFEFNVECYDPALAQSMGREFDRRRQAARPVTLAEVDARGYAIRLRDGLARFLTPFL